MFELLLEIPKEKTELWEEFQKKLRNFVVGYSTKSSRFDFAHRAALIEEFKTYLQKIFVDNHDCSNFLIRILDFLLEEALKQQHICDLFYLCKDGIPDDHWQMMLTCLGLSPQPGLTRFELIKGIFLTHMAAKKNTAIEGFLAFKKAMEDCDSFPSLLILCDLFYHQQLQNAIQIKRDTVGIQNIKQMYLEIVQHGEIHGTPTYLLRANFCFWCAQYYQEVLGDKESADAGYRLAIQYLTCADKIKFFSQEAVNNAFYACPLLEKTYGKYNFFKRLSVIMEGKVESLIEEIIKLSKLLPLDVTVARNYGIAAAKKWIDKYITNQTCIVSPVQETSCSPFTSPQ